jgi:hypothetical protein
MRRTDPKAHYEIAANIKKMRTAGLSQEQALAVALKWRTIKVKKRLQTKQKTATVNTDGALQPTD